jgi:hypothetical protein
VSGNPALLFTGSASILLFIAGAPPAIRNSLRTNGVCPIRQTQGMPVKTQVKASIPAIMESIFVDY